jgi:putative salt-induced outer membrane protein
MKPLFWLLPVCCGLFTAHALAETATANDETTSHEVSPFSGNAKLGFIYSKASDTSLSINSGATLKYKLEKWQQQADIATYFTSSTNEEDGTNKYNLSYGLKHDLKQQLFVFGSNKYEHDQYGTYRDQVVVVVGFGSTLIDTENTQLSVGAGPGYRFSQRQPTDPDLPSKKSDEVIANGFIEGSAKFSVSFEIGGKVNVDYGEENTTTNIKGYIKNQLMDKLALLLDTEYIYNTTVASDSNNDEVYSTISITYDF